MQHDDIQRRVAAHTRRVFVEMKFVSQNQYAKALGISQPHLSQVLMAKSSAGLDFVVSLARVSREPLDRLVFSDPAPEWFRTGMPDPRLSWLREGDPVPTTPRAGRPRKT